MLKLAAHASFEQTTGETPAPLRSLLEQESGMRVRRVNRFIELALLGAARCLKRMAQAPAPDTALYLCSDTGMLDQTAALLQNMQSTSAVPKPFEFMNLSGSMASFQVAQQFSLNGPQLCLHGHYASFEQALQLLMLQSAPHSRALVGVVEEGSWPESDQRQRLSWSGSLVEFSHWFYFDRDCASPIASIDFCGHGLDLRAASAGLAPLASTARLQGSTHGDDAPPLEQWAATLGVERHSQETPPGDRRGRSARALSRAIAAGAPGEGLVYVNQIQENEYYLTCSSFR